MATEPVADWRVPDAYWYVTDPDHITDHVFTSDMPAFAHAVHNARTDRATLITAPDGVQTLVLRVDPHVQIQAVRPLTGGGR